jgi:hypothetical protein
MHNPFGSTNLYGIRITLYPVDQDHLDTDPLEDENSKLNMVNLSKKFNDRIPNSGTNTDETMRQRFFCNVTNPNPWN